MHFFSSLGGALRRGRESQGLTQVAACKLIGIKQSHLSAIENNLNLPSQATLDRMIVAFGLRRDAILDLYLGGTAPATTGDLSPVHQKLIKAWDEKDLETIKRLMKMRFGR